MKLILLFASILAALSGCKSDLAIFMQDRATFSINSAANLVATDSYVFSWEPIAKASAYDVVISQTTSCQEDGRIKVENIRDTSLKLDFLAEGNYHLCVFARIGSSSVAAKNNGIPLTIDRSSPIVSMQSDVQTFVGKFVPDVKVEDISKVTIEWSQIAGDGALTIADPKSMSSEVWGDTTGLYKIKAVVTDQVGHTSEFTYQFYWKSSPSEPDLPAAVGDIKPPLVTVSSLSTQDLAPALSGTVDDPDAMVKVSVNGIQYSAVNDRNGNWSISKETLAVLPNGTYNIAATATDPAGNVGTDTTSNELTIAAQVFVSLWKTDNAGVSNSQSIKLPLDAAGIFDFEADWGDGTKTRIQSGSDPLALHSYSTPGTYTVSLRGVVDGFHFSQGGDKLKILEVSQWGGLKLGRFGGTFWEAHNLTVTATDVPDLSGGTLLTDLFSGASALTTVPNIHLWNVSHITNFQGTFADLPFFNDDISGWNVSSGQNFRYMFCNAFVFNRNLNSWNMASATSLENMFTNARAFNSPLNSWNVSNVTNIAWMFQGASLFNQNLNSWNTSKVNWMEGVFNDAIAFNGNIKDWDTHLVPSMKDVFAGATHFNQDLSDWDVSHVTNMRSMFNRATVFNSDISGWDTSSVVDFAWMFNEANAFSQDIGSWGTSSAVYMDRMFRWANSFNHALNWDVDRVWDFTMMFERSAFNSSLTSWHTDAAVHMSAMFRDSPFNQPIPNFNTSLVKDMSAMFQGTPFNQDVSMFNTGSAENMAFMFAWASHFNQPVSHFNTINVQDMSSMFEGANVFNHPLGNWSTANVLYMAAMFKNCWAFNQDVGNWNTSKVTNTLAMFEATPANYPLNWDMSANTNMSWMFKGAWNYDQPMNWDTHNVTAMIAMLEGTPINQDLNWNTSKVTNMSWMFKNAWNFNGDISGWDTSKVTTFQEMFKQASAFNRNIGNWNTGSATNFVAMFGFSNFNQNLGGWNVTKAEDMSWMFDSSSAMSRANYDATLIGWAGQAVKNAVVFDGSGAHYTSGGAAQTARDYLTGTKGWAIYDAGGLP